jgi:hypothetical protein|tara:strand:+ start:489 stop:800 length:312 start_codon:yes stop_codon:yes gene_type:complete
VPQHRVLRQQLRPAHPLRFVIVIFDIVIASHHDGATPCIPTSISAGNVASNIPRAPAATTTTTTAKAPCVLDSCLVELCQQINSFTSQKIYRFEQLLHHSMWI